MTPRKPRAKAPVEAPLEESPQAAAPEVPHTHVGGARRVVMAYTMSVEGVDYTPESIAELPARVALDLVRRGRARWAEKEE